MSRAIKFRVWDKRNSRWFHGSTATESRRLQADAINLFGETIVLGELTRDQHTDEFVSIDRYADLVPLQYTGLKDKNSVEIYEGDIIKILQRDWPSQLDSYPELSHEQYLDMLAHRLVVEFAEGAFMMVRHYGEDGDYYQGFNEGGYKDIFEVIGNIYENPDLLEPAG